MLSSPRRRRRSPSQSLSPPHRLPERDGRPDTATLSLTARARRWAAGLDVGAAEELSPGPVSPTTEAALPSIQAIQDALYRTPEQRDHAQRRHRGSGGSSLPPVPYIWRDGCFQVVSADEAKALRVTDVKVWQFTPERGVPQECWQHQAAELERRSLQLGQAEAALEMERARREEQAERASELEAQLEQASRPPASRAVCLASVPGALCLSPAALRPPHAASGRRRPPGAGNPAA